MSNRPISPLKLTESTDPILNRVADEVDTNEIPSKPIQEVIDFMLELSAGKGRDKKDSRQMVGLAAPQVGVSKRIITIDITADGSNKEQTLKVFINPKITKRSAKIIPGREGCWSCGNICGNVDRAEKVTLEGIDREGNQVSLELSGFVARIAQHETDHLDGIRFPDRIPESEPSRLHWVLPSEFGEYREKWQNWPVLCPRERWEALKCGEVDPHK